jgi:hypothetical protein
MPLRPLILFASSATESVLRDNSLSNLDSVFECRNSARLRHKGRAVWKTQLKDQNGENFTAYVKLSWGRRRWWPRLADVRNGQVLKSLAIREWEGLDVFERLGLHVPERLALLEEGLLWKRSAVILRAVPPPACLSEMILDGSWLRLPQEDRHSILEEVARTLCTIHEAGWAWRSVSTRHIFPHRTSRGSWELWLIDCEGVHGARSPEILDRDFERLLRALSHDRADEQTLDTMRKLATRSAKRRDLSGENRLGTGRRAA